MDDNQPKAVYFIIDSYEAGIQNTGKRSANYHCWCEILDINKDPIKTHPLNDVFYGKWGKCQKVITKWQKQCERANLNRTIKTQPSK